MVDIDQQTKEAKREEKYEESKKQHTHTHRLITTKRETKKKKWLKFQQWP